MFAVVQTPHALGRVLNHIQPVGFRDGVEPVHFTRVSVEMHGDNRLGPGGNRPLHSVRVHRPVILAHVHKNRRRAGIGHGVGRSHPGAVRQNYFVPWLDADGQQGQVERGGARRRSHRVFHAQRFAHRLFKPLNVVKAFLIPAGLRRVRGIVDLQRPHRASRDQNRL